MGKVIKFTVFFGILIFFIGCKQDDCCEPEDESPVTFALPDLQSSSRKFSGNLFKEIMSGAEVDENVVISPLSILTALYMTYNGSAGETRADMSSALELEENIDPESVNKIYLELLEILTPEMDSVEMHMANGVFWDKDRIDPHSEFLNAMETTYEAELIPEQFESDPEGTLEKINNWVDTHTEGRIQKILEELSPEEVMFIINALYIKASWLNPFDPDNTTDFPFTKADGEEIFVPYLNKDFQLSYSNNSDFQAVKLPFKDTSYAMHFIIPSGDLESFIAETDYPEFFESLDNIYQQQRIQLFLPKFETEYKANLTEVLKLLGMETAFDPIQADFSDLGEANGNLFLSRVEHKTYFKMDEKGVEGAAVTAVGVGVTSLPPRVWFNKPFLFVLYHHKSGTPVFIGKISNPNKN